VDVLTANNQSNFLNSNNTNQANTQNNLNKINLNNNPIISMIPNNLFSKAKNTQSRNHSLNLRNYTNNLKNSYAQDNSLKQQQIMNLMRTYSGGQDIKSSSLSNTKNQNNKSTNSNQVNTNIINNQLNKNIINISDNQNIHNNFKKVQPKIIKNTNNNIQTKLPSNYVEILNKRKLENSRNNFIMGGEFMRVANNTKNNMSSMTRSKFLNASAMHAGNATGLNNLNSSNLLEKERANSQNRETKVSTQLIKNQQINSNTQVIPANNTFNLNNININIHTTGHSRNRNKNEISTLSDLTNSLNRGLSQEETKRESRNIIIKPKINISFVNNMVGSLESINNTLNINHSQNYADSCGKSNNKKSRNEKVDIFLKNKANTNKTLKNMKNNNFKSMIMGLPSSYNKTKSRNIKNNYSINFETLSKGNTIEKDKEQEFNSNVEIEGKKLNRNTYDNLNYDNLNKKSPNQTQNKYNYCLTGQYGSCSAAASANNNSHLNSNSILGKEKDFSIINSNYAFLKQKISNLKIGLKQGKVLFKNHLGVKTTSIGLANNSNSNNSAFISNKPNNKFLMLTKTTQNMSTMKDTSKSFLLTKNINTNIKINQFNNTSLIVKPKINK